MRTEPQHPGRHGGNAVGAQAELRTPEVMAIAAPHTHERVDRILIIADTRRETDHLAFVEHLVIEGIKDGDGGRLIVDRQSLLRRTGQTDEPECNKSDSHGVISMV